MKVGRRTTDILENAKRIAAFDMLDAHLRDAKKEAVELKLGEHFISDIDHLRAVVKANREES